MPNRKRETEAFFHDFDYDACTLNLGLDIMEMLVAEDAPATLEAMAARLSASVDIVRHVVDFLEARGYLVRSRADAMRSKIKGPEALHILTPALRDLVRHAMPIMQKVSDDLGQSCNLSVPSGHNLLMIAQTRPDSPFCINMPIGCTYAMSRMAPWLAGSAGVAAGAWGYIETENPFLEDVTDVSCRVTGLDGPIAILTIPYLRTAGGAGMVACASEMIQAAIAISEALMGSRLVA